MQIEETFTHVGTVITDYGDYKFPLNEVEGGYTDYTKSLVFNKKTGEAKGSNNKLKTNSVRPFPRNTKSFLMKS